MIAPETANFLKKNGYLIIEALLSKEEVIIYSKHYHYLLEAKGLTANFRSDLSGVSSFGEVEQITQIMRPSKLLPELLHMPLHTKALKITQELLGADMALDFDMLINKAPYTDTPTPWHQDAAYWIDMPDKRALSFWVAIDKATKDNGCMWYTPKSHLPPLQNHKQPTKGGALQCSGSEKNSVAVPLNPGSCVLHFGETLHYSRGNSTAENRRAFILNFRPQKMIDLERAAGFDHTGERQLSKI